MQLKIKTPAKINLTLEVLNKREDGYHNIQSIMQMINLYDYLTISVEDSDEELITLSGTTKNPKLDGLPPILTNPSIHLLLAGFKS